MDQLLEQVHDDGAGEGVDVQAPAQPLQAPKPRQALGGHFERNVQRLLGGQGAISPALVQKQGGRADCSY
jgi:hypothetical protein